MQFIGGGWGDIFLVKIKSKKNMIILTNWSVRKVTFFLTGFFFLRRGECLPILGHKDLIQSKYTPV